MAANKKRVLDNLGIMYPPAGMATSFEEAEQVAARIGYPLLVRPSYVLGGRGMMIAYDSTHLREYMAEATRISPDYPVYLDRFLEGAIESDVDALCDGEEVYIGGILEHIEDRFPLLCRRKCRRIGRVRAYLSVVPRLEDKAVRHTHLRRAAAGIQGLRGVYRERDRRACSPRIRRSGPHRDNCKKPITKTHKHITTFIPWQLSSLSEASVRHAKW